MIWVNGIEMSKVKIGSSKKGYVLEIVEYQDILYHRQWETGEFEIDSDDKVIDKTGDVSLKPEALISVRGDADNIVFWDDPINLVDGTKINTDPNSEDFKNNSTTKEYRIKEGYEIIKSE
tara:strand:- start:87 stop:446 length:360 start_codon:yes stop_codon:yes gene_type:complete